jgi:hypothetical protein
VKRITTVVEFAYDLTDVQYTDFGPDDVIGMAIDAFLNPEPGDHFVVATHSVVEGP